MVYSPFMQNREIAWLRFNERVLDEAQMSEVPLLERLKFISIYDSNLDEFFMVRVGALCDLKLLEKFTKDSKTGMTPDQQIKKILEIVPAMYQKKDSIYLKLLSQLEFHHIRSLRFEQLSDSQLEFAEKYYHTQIEELIFPQVIDKRHPLPFLENNRLYIITELEKNEKSLLCLIPIQKHLPSFLMLTGHQVGFILMEELILGKVESIFKDYKVMSKTIISVTRNADLNADNENQDLFEDYKEFMKFIVKKRKRLSTVRLESQGKLPNHIKSFLLENLKLDNNHYFVSQSPLAMDFVFPLINAVPSAYKEELLYKPIHAFNPFLNSPSIINEVREKDQFLSYPYDDINGYIQLLKEIANDTDCLAIKITIYRLAKNSEIVKYLCKAAENGIEVTVLMELKARFDEESNIKYAGILAEAGCNIIYGFEEYKTHSKIFLAIFKDKKDNFNYITQIGTGNYNESTSKLYTDFSLITANYELGLDASDFFKNLSLGNLNGKYKHLLQAPTSMGQRFEELIDIEIAKGQNGYLFFKFNSLTDYHFINKLVEAAQAGVRVKLIIRGICCLLPGIEGKTDNIEIHSIVGRYLEHPRIYIFGNDESQTIYIASADLMTRNMKERVEIAAPIFDANIRARILDYMEKQFNDTVKGRQIQSTGDFSFIKMEMGSRALSSQDQFIQEAEEKYQLQLDAGLLEEEIHKGPSIEEVASRRGFLAKLVSWLRK